MGATFIRTCIAIGATVMSGAAYAHPGHADGALAGLLHPLLGMDHLLAMIAAGVWASQLGERDKRLLPVSFVVVMGVAALAAVAGLVLPVFEFGIAGSLLLAGLLIAFRMQVTPIAGAAIVGLFALFHGYAHGAELPTQVAAWQYFAGFLASTFLLIRFGQWLGPVIARRKAGLPAACAVLFASGGWMMASLA